MNGEVRLIVALIRDALHDARKGSMEAEKWINGPAFVEFVNLISNETQADLIIGRARERIRRKK